MFGNYALMLEDKRLGLFYIDSGENLVIYEAESEVESQPILFMLDIKRNGKVRDSVAYHWIINRAPESNAELIEGMLKKVGIKEYCPFAFVEYNGGRFNTDKFYLEKIN